MKKRKTVIASLAILGVLFITAGVSYAFFSYSREGTTGNTISSGSITFHYQEGAQGLSLNDVMPMTDAQGKAQNTYFDFNITSKTSNTVEIPYDITVRRSGTGTNMDNVVKVYLTKVDNGVETPVQIVTGKSIATVSELSTYLNSTLNIDASKNEKKLTTETVPSGSNNYNQAYRLRMWISTDADFSLVPAHCSDSTYTTEETCEGAEEEWIPDDYPYNNKTYTLKVNVYGEGAATSGTTRLAPGLYDANDNLIESYDDLVTKTGWNLDAESYYSNFGSVCYGEYAPVDMSYCEATTKYIIQNNSEYQNAKKLVIPDTITTIGEFGLYATGLKFVYVPSTVTSIGSAAFSGVDFVYYDGPAVDDGNHWGAIAINPYFDGDFVYEDSTRTTLIKYTGNSTSVEIPSSVTTIGDDAFSDTGITSIEIPSSVTTIGNRAFSDTGITSIEIPSSVTTIGDDAFYSCENLTTVTFAPNSQLTSIGGFSHTGITSITIPSSVTTIGDYAFSDTGITSIEIPSSVTSIGESAFSQTGLTSITIPSSVTSIGNGAFLYCENLTTVTFASNSQLTSIDSNAFSQTGLTSITIPASVTSIGGSAFSGNSNLTAVIFENGSHLVRLGRYAFASNNQLTSITIPSSVTSIGRGAFGCPITSATFANPNGWSAGETALSSTDLSNTSTAADYLRSTYSDYNWTRSN